MARCSLYSILLGRNIQKITSKKRLRLIQPKPAPPVFCYGLNKKSEIFQGVRGAGRALFHECRP